MPRPVVKGLLFSFFAALLAAPLVLERLSAQPPGPSLDSEAALERYGFFLEDVAQAAGIDFTHQAPRLDPLLDHIMPQVASVGAAVSVVDFDRDGWHDLYVTNSGENSRNALYRNLGDGTFMDVAGTVGLADLNNPESGASMGSVWGDFDNDGYEDLFLYRWGRAELFRNENGKGFTRVDAGFPEWVNANTALWLDYDLDGHLDLFLAGYFPENVNLWRLETTRIMPESFEYARNGGRKYLFRNRGDGTFEEVSEQLGLTSRRWTLSAAAADINGSGYPDLVIANDYGVEEVFINHEGKRFEQAGERLRIGFAPKSGMNVAFGDILNRGELAIYVTNISEEGVLIQGNNLWVPSSGGQRYENMAGAMGVELGGWSYGAQFGDLNNDGNLDLYLTNGYVSADPDANYWYDFSKVAGGNRAIIGDAKNWPPMNGRSLSGYQSKRVWLNDGAGRFRDVAQMVGASDRYDGRAVVMADLWNRGVLDVVVANQRGPLLVYKNTAAAENHWISFELEGTASNRSAIGAQVRLECGGRQQLQEVAGGSGFSAQNQRRLHFGLGADPTVDRVSVRWPSGKIQVIERPEAGRMHTLTEPL